MKLIKNTLSISVASLLIFVVATAQGSDFSIKEHYYGKSLDQLKQQDHELKNALSQAWWDMFHFESYYFAVRPSARWMPRIGKNIGILQSKIKIINDCLKQAKGELCAIQQEPVNIPGKNSVMGLVNLFIFAPWIAADAYSKNHALEAKEKEIKIMVSAVQEIQTKIDGLEDILDYYTNKHIKLNLQ